MDWNRCILSQSDNKNLLDPSRTLNPRVCAQKITVDLNYLRSEGSIALTLKQNYEQWHKNCALEVTSFRFKRALSNVSKNETENELPTKMTRAILPVQQSISDAICFFCDSAGVFSKQDFAGSQKQKRITYYIVLSHLIVTVKFDKQRHKWEIQNCEPNYQKETWWLGKRAIIKTV